MSLRWISDVFTYAALIKNDRFVVDTPVTSASCISSMTLRTCAAFVKHVSVRICSKLFKQTYRLGARMLRIMRKDQQARRYRSTFTLSQYMSGKLGICAPVLAWRLPSVSQLESDLAPAFCSSARVVY